MRFNDETLQCEVIRKDKSLFMFINRKTTPIKDENKDIIYELVDDPRPNHIRNIRKSAQKINKKISRFFQENKVFYQDNEVGEIVRNYLVQCAHDIRS